MSSKPLGAMLALNRARTDARHSQRRFAPDAGRSNPGWASMSRLSYSPRSIFSVFLSTHFVWSVNDNDFIRFLPHQILAFFCKLVDKNVVVDVNYLWWGSSFDSKPVGANDEASHINFFLLGGVNSPSQRSAVLRPRMCSDTLCRFPYQ